MNFPVRFNLELTNLVVACPICKEKNAGVVEVEAEDTNFSLFHSVLGLKKLEFSTGRALQLKSWKIHQHWSFSASISWRRWKKR